MQRRTHFFLAAAGMALLPQAASAHVGAGTTASFAAGFAHPLGGLDHVCGDGRRWPVGALKGDRALWLWPLAFVSVMVVGALLGMAQIQLPFVEPAILASVVAIGLLVALAVDCPLWVGAAIIAAFAVFHGHAHGTEIPESANGVHYLAGFAGGDGAAACGRSCAGGGVFCAAVSPR